MTDKATLVGALRHAARIVTDRISVGGEPNLLNCLPQWVGDLCYEIVSVIVTVGVVVPVNYERVARDGVRP